MSENPYLDTYYGQIVDVTDPDNPEGVELVTVRATDFDHARALVLENTATPIDENIEVRVRRFRADTLVESPADKYRRWRHMYGRNPRSRAPQYYAHRKRKSVT